MIRRTILFLSFIRISCQPYTLCPCSSTPRSPCVAVDFLIYSSNGVYTCQSMELSILTSGARSCVGIEVGGGARLSVVKSESFLGHSELQLVMDEFEWYRAQYRTRVRDVS